MPDKKIFCSSPWLHIKIGYSGRYLPCRWMSLPSLKASDQYMQDISLLEYYNSVTMRRLRIDLVNDQIVDSCSNCHYEDSFGKVSGRIRQLYRSKIDIESFNEDYAVSPHLSMFEDSLDDGHSSFHPYDLQINLSNVCNNACIMCSPIFSSRLKQDFNKLSKTFPLLFEDPADMKCWADDPILVEKFISDIKELPSVDYLHLLGGETLYLESFYNICEALIDSGLSKNISLGTTTNLSIFTDRLAEIIPKFSKFHIGLSIESVNHLNDYIRYPSEITSVLNTLGKFLDLRNQYPALHLTLRITPNIFSIFYIDEVIQYMCDNNLTGESCNILAYPNQLRIELLPENLRMIIIEKLKKVIEKNSLVRAHVIDARNPELVTQVISTVAFSYVDVLENMVLPSDGEQYRRDLITFLTGFESIRNNSILDYAPEYEAFLTEYGYKRKSSIDYPPT